MFAWISAQSLAARKPLVQAGA